MYCALVTGTSEKSVLDKYETRYEGERGKISEGESESEK